jgi:hypothetical protein
MRSWNAHAWYCVGILLALLIGTVSVQWNTVDRLPEIISFAVGLSSLLLAVFAIIQTMTAGNDASATLAAVREAATDLKTTAGGTLTTLGDLKTLSDSMLASSESNRETLAEIKSKIDAKTETGARAKSGDSAQVAVISLGGGPALYAAILALQHKKSFNFDDIFPEDSNTDYERGYLDALRAADLVDFKLTDKVRTITRISLDADKLAETIKSHTFPNPVSTEQYRKRLTDVESYFSQSAGEGENV